MGLQTTEEFSKYIGIPHTQLDCWGLVELFYLNEFNIVLRKYYKEIPKNRLESDWLVNAHKDDFKKVEYPKYGDIILMSVLGSLSHVGIFIDSNRMLHSDHLIDSVIEPWNSMKWRKRIEGFYRCYGYGDKT